MFLTLRTNTNNLHKREGSSPSLDISVLRDGNNILKIKLYGKPICYNVIMIKAFNERMVYTSVESELLDMILFLSRLRSSLQYKQYVLQYELKFIYTGKYNVPTQQTPYINR